MRRDSTGADSTASEIDEKSAPTRKPANADPSRTPDSVPREPRPRDFKYPERRPIKPPVPPLQSRDSLIQGEATTPI